MKCEKNDCIANLDEECIVEKCRGEINITSDITKRTLKVRRKLYNSAADIFEDDFGEEVRRQWHTEIRLSSPTVGGGEGND